MRQTQKIASARTGSGRLALKLALWLAACLVLAGGAQSQPDWLQQRHPGMESSGSESGQPDGGSPESEKRLRALNAERQKSLVADTNKLLKLATELEAEMKLSEAPTAEQLHKAGEIEKLARSVREKMSTSVRSTPIYRPPFGFPPAD